MALVFSTAALAVVGGSPDSTHTYVGAAIQHQVQTGVDGTELCTGFVITATKFVTAAHCFDPNGDPITVTFDENAIVDGKPNPDAHFVAGTVVNDPDYCSNCGHGGTPQNDVAVITLSEAQSGPFAQLPPIGYDDTLPKNQLVDVVGYGVQSFAKKSPTAFGTRQIAVTTTENAGANSDAYLKLDGDPGACFGDSGGPDLQHGTNLALAINTFTTGGSTCKGATFSQRADVPAIQAFILGASVAAGGSGSGGHSGQSGHSSPGDYFLDYFRS
jgi:hypothetical protein